MHNNPIITDEESGNMRHSRVATFSGALSTNFSRSPSAKYTPSTPLYYFHVFLVTAYYGCDLLVTGEAEKNTDVILGKEG